MAAGPRPFPTSSQTIPAGTTGSVVISSVPATLADVTNTLNATSVAVSLNNASSAGGITAANAFYAQQSLGPGQIYTFNRYCSAGIVITFASALVGNVDVTWTPLNGGV